MKAIWIPRHGKPGVIDAVGDQTLIHQAAGGVGTAVSQLCRSVRGVTTYGTASERKHDHVRHNGCNVAIDYHTVDYALPSCTRILGLAKTSGRSY
jgi:NADPH:quinone reductase-like Zn-dependent oxidoreductase